MKTWRTVLQLLGNNAYLIQQITPMLQDFKIYLYIQHKVVLRSNVLEEEINRCLSS